MAEHSKARLFVLFLDTYHVDIGASHAIRKTLIDALDRVIGQDDLVAVMTPDMSAADIVFARRTTTIERILTRHWNWGERDSSQPPDPQDRAYAECYPNVNESGASARCRDQNGVAAEMIDRRHEKLALDALEDRCVPSACARGAQAIRRSATAAAVSAPPGLTRQLGATACHRPPSHRSSDRRLTAAITATPPFAARPTDRLANLATTLSSAPIPRTRRTGPPSFYPIDPRGLACRYAM